MIALKVFLLLQGLLLAAWCDVWPREQEIKDSEEEQLKHIAHQHQDSWDHEDPYGYSGTGHHGAGAQSSDVSGTVHYRHHHRQVNPSHGHQSEDLSVDTEDGSAKSQGNNIPARMGNWCAFVHKKVLTMSVACGNEKYIIKSQSPCPNGTPDCSLIMYKISTRPVYREKQKILTALLWRCCPGHGGTDCEDIVEDSHVSESEGPSTDIRLHPGGPKLNDTGPGNNQNQEMNEQEFRGLLYESLSSEKPQTEEQHSSTPSPHAGHEPHSETVASNGGDDGRQGPSQQTHYANSGLVPIHYLKDVMMSHLQPIFDSFNLTLTRLSEEVGDLQKDMTKLQVEQMLQKEPKMEEGWKGELEELNRQLDLQQDEMEMKLHAQQVMLHYNLTNLKTDMDNKIKHKQKTLQTSLHSINSSLSNVRERQDQLEEELQKVLRLASNIASPGRQPQEDTALWEAITRLDNKVVNNSIRLGDINEEQVQVSGKIKHLQKDLKNLDEHISRSDRRNEDRYIEAFLEVDAAKEAVGKHTDDLSKNVTALQKTVKELESDVDYLWDQFPKNKSFGSRDCDCIGLSTSVALLERAVANITVIANENRLALDNAAEDRVKVWESGGLGPSVAEIKLSLHSVQSLLALEQERRRTLQETVHRLQTSHEGSQKDIKALQQEDMQKAGKIKMLLDSFNSLLKDAIRHNDVLQILLGEEVLEFIDWSPDLQKTHSIPALQELINDLQEQINGHSRSLASMLNSEDPTADELSDRIHWNAEDLKKIDHFPKDLTRYKDKDFLDLEKTVEQLKGQVVKLREQQCLACCNSTDCATSKDRERKLQAELASVHKSLDNHLRVFSSVFSNTEGLTESEATVDLEKLFALMKKKEAKLQRKRGKKRADTSGGQRSKRGTSDEALVHKQLPELNSFMFVASSRDSVNTTGTVVFETTSLNQGQTYSDETGTFRAPTAGFYLVMMTLNFGPGPSIAMLKKGETVKALLHQDTEQPSEPVTRHFILQLQEGEEVHIELVQGTLEHRESQENLFAVLLLQQFI